MPVAVTCRVLGLSRSTFYDARGRPPSARDVEDAYLANTIVSIHAMSRRRYGAPRAHAELRLGHGVRVGRKRVARLMRCAGVRGIGGNPKSRRGRPAEAVHDDLVQRRLLVHGSPEVVGQMWANGDSRAGAGTKTRPVTCGFVHNLAVAA